MSADHAEGLTAEMIGVESAIQEAMDRAQKVTRTVAALTRQPLPVEPDLREDGPAAQRLEAFLEGLPRSKARTQALIDYGTVLRDANDALRARLAAPADPGEDGFDANWRERWPSKDKRRIRIWIDRAPYIVTKHTWTGAELRLLPVPAIESDRHLFMVDGDRRNPGAPMDLYVDDDTIVKCRDEERFVTVPKHITGG